MSKINKNKNKHKLIKGEFYPDWLLNKIAILKYRKQRRLQRTQELTDNEISDLIGSKKSDSK